MATLLHLNFSPRGKDSESAKLSQTIVTSLLQSRPGATVITRTLGGGEIGFIDADYATSQQSTEDVSQDGTMARSEEFIRELEQADVVVIGTPMHNYMVPAALKMWIDQVVRARRTFNVTPAGKVGLLRDRPVFVAISSGGRFSGERARQPDFLTPYLKAILGMVGLNDVTFFSVQGTAYGGEALAAERGRTAEALQAHLRSLSATL